MKLQGAKSKRQKTSLKYNIQKRVREHKRRLKKEAKKSGILKRKRRDPGIPNSWPFKAEMLDQIEEKKAKMEEEREKAKAQAKSVAKKERKARVREKKETEAERQKTRHEKRLADIERTEAETLRKMFQTAEVFVEVLDARDPWGCRCESLEAMVQQQGKRLMFAVTKADLIPGDVAAKWLQVLGTLAPVAITSCETGREGVQDLLKLLGHGGVAGIESAKAVALIGYPGTGKSSLAKSIRQEVKSGTTWLCDSVGRLRPDEEQLEELPVVVQQAIRGTPPTASADSPEPPENGCAAVMKLLLEQRVPAPAVMRRLRLAAFDSPASFLKVFAADRALKNKKGKMPNDEIIAKQALTELMAPPGLHCSPPPPSSEGPWWAQHAAAKVPMQASMTAQHAVFSQRSGGPAAASLSLTSAGFGPAIDIEAYQESEVGDDMTDDDELAEEGAEEEDLEDDEEMDDDE
jgi:nuclear GTP-binding protein